MKTRHVFGTPDIDVAESAVDALRQASLADDCISLIARHDIESRFIPEDQQDTEDDFGRGGMKGLLAGGGSGLLVGLVAVAVPPLGLPLAGAALTTIADAATGSWVGMLTGTSEPGAVRRKFEGEIAAGRVLVIVVDGDAATLAVADAALVATGATALPFDAPTAPCLDRGKRAQPAGFVSRAGVARRPAKSPEARSVHAHACPRREDGGGITLGQCGVLPSIRRTAWATRIFRSSVPPIPTTAGTP